MLKFDNTHLFTGYLKQLLSSFNIPVCRIYTKEFADYFSAHGKEDPRVLESFNNIEYIYDSKSNYSKNRIAVDISYLRGKELYNYYWDFDQNKPELNHNATFWKCKCNSAPYYGSTKKINGLTKTLRSYGNVYDTATHEFLGDYLRFLRDYYNINLMSLYNCFNNKICNNLYYKYERQDGGYSSIFDSNDEKYIIYAFPVKLFQNYTIALDCSQEVEMFCGFYKTALDTSTKSRDLIAKTYKKINKTLFRQPFLYDALDVKYWNFEQASRMSTESGHLLPQIVNNSVITRWDIANREQNLKLFIKIPASCQSSITVLEGDFRNFNDYKYVPTKYENKTLWKYTQNHSVINFEDEQKLNECNFNLISKLQLLAFNTGTSYPFADRLIEYLCGSAVTPLDEIPDNIKRVQEVMTQNQHYFKIAGLWEDKMQKIVYDFLMNSGPIEAQMMEDGAVKLVDKRLGYHARLGHTSKSTLYDILGYVDKDAEKWYTSWKLDGKVPKVRDSIQNVNIYGNLYDL